ncbi:hypothetical protein OSB04_010761 [Centaurea solstitialis]|uniref:Integrase catalytic domain-containing protein n=1 Tax=Centaurea solstitialis TaxID=347529 RepID=A0AA38WCA1_9ASTR|nr:hypothetical protein OSB04_010761 [Centaurea solstitialis]
MASPSTNENNIPLNTIIHMLTIKLGSTNYLLWKNQIIPILSYQNLLNHVDGTGIAPPSTRLEADKIVDNPDYSAWVLADQKTVIILHASLSEEAVTLIVGLSTARQIWTALEAAYGNSSIERVHTIRDQLRLIQKGSKSVAEYGRLFKNLCDQLAAIGHPVDESDQLHWFLCGLGPSFETFSTTIRSARPAPSFADLLARTESHELFSQALHRSSSPTVAFTATHQSQPSAGRGRGGRSSRAPNQNGGRGRGRRPPHCQLCRTNGHYANLCPQLSSFASRPPAVNDELAKAFAAHCHVTTATPDWYVDSGATDHMTATSDNVTNATPASGTNFVTFGNNQGLPISHTGSSRLHHNLVLNNILVVPRLTKNLLSVSKLTRDNHVDVLFSYPHFVVQDRTTKQVLAQGKCDQGLYVLQSSPQALIASNKTPKASFETWHSRLGHVNFDTLFYLHKLGLLSFTALLPKPGVCLSCQMAKNHKLPFELNHKRAAHPLELIHCDVWGPSPVESHDNFRYYIVFVDDHSRFSWLYPLSRKSDVYKAIEVFVAFVQTQFSCKIKVFQSDGGTEFVNHRVRALFDANGTLHRLSSPYTPPQNARAERKHRHIVETGLAMLFNANLPSTFWVDAFTSAVHIINRLPTKVLDGKSPFEILYHRVPDYSTFRTFGCRVFPYLRHYSEHKLAPRSLPCVFIGYSSKYKGFRCLDPVTSRIYVSSHAQFDEKMFPFSSSTIAEPNPDLPVLTFSDFPILQPTNPPISSCQPPAPTSSPCPLCMDSPLTPPSIAQSLAPQPTPPTVPAPPTTTPLVSAAHPTSPTVPASPTTTPLFTAAQPTSPTIPAPPIIQQPPVSAPTNSSHPMITRAKAGIFKPRHIADLSQLNHLPLHSALYATTDPTSFKTAERDPKWVRAMQQELDALRKNNTWSLVPRPINRKIVGSKWLYRTKFHSDGSVERYKARLVAQGFSQTPGLDYSHTFSPVVKASTVRVILSLAVINKWNLHQLDVNNAFLHGHLDECVYMEQPPGFAHPNFPHHVCKLNKALYGLKQAPRAWFHRLSTFLLANGFKGSRADTSLFVFKRDTCIMYMLVYVDDLILTGSDEKIIVTPHFQSWKSSGAWLEIYFCLIWVTKFGGLSVKCFLRTYREREEATLEEKIRVSIGGLESSSREIVRVFVIKAFLEREKLKFEAPGSASSVYEKEGEEMVVQKVGIDIVTRSTMNQLGCVWGSITIGRVYVLKFEGKKDPVVNTHRIIETEGVIHIGWHDRIRSQVVIRRFELRSSLHGLWGIVDSSSNLSGGELTIEGDGRDHRRSGHSKGSVGASERLRVDVGVRGRDEAEPSRVVPRLGDFGDEILFLRTYREREEATLEEKIRVSIGGLESSSREIVRVFVIKAFLEREKLKFEAPGSASSVYEKEGEEMVVQKVVWF